jgi:hypothetical protein
MFALIKLPFRHVVTRTGAASINPLNALFSSSSTIPGDFKDKEAFEETRYIREMEKEMMIEFKRKQEAELKRQKKDSSPSLRAVEQETADKKKTTATEIGRK